MSEKLRVKRGLRRRRREGRLGLTFLAHDGVCSLWVSVCVSVSVVDVCSGMKYYATVGRKAPRKKAGGYPGEPRRQASKGWEKSHRLSDPDQSYRRRSTPIDQLPNASNNNQISPMQQIISAKLSAVRIQLQRESAVTLLFWATY